MTCEVSGSLRSRCFCELCCVWGPSYLFLLLAPGLKSATHLGTPGQGGTSCVSSPVQPVMGPAPRDALQACGASRRVRLASAWGREAGVRELAWRRPWHRPWESYRAGGCGPAPAPPSPEGPEELLWAGLGRAARVVNSSQSERATSDPLLLPGPLISVRPPSACLCLKGPHSGPFPSLLLPCPLLPSSTQSLKGHEHTEVSGVRIPFNSLESWPVQHRCGLWAPEASLEALGVRCQWNFRHSGPWTALCLRRAQEEQFGPRGLFSEAAKSNVTPWRVLGHLAGAAAMTLSTSLQRLCSSLCLCPCLLLGCSSLCVIWLCWRLVY